MRDIELTGLTAGPPQRWCALRLVPLLRAEPITDLRLHQRAYADDDPSVVDVRDGTAYTSFIPHAFVADWTDDGSAAASYGVQLLAKVDEAPQSCARVDFRGMSRAENRGRARFLPAQLAMEGYLALHFRGPGIAWPEWSRRFVDQGMTQREETTFRGGEIVGLDDALRVFEIHPGQCGMALYAADALAAVFVVPHPDDYRRLHATMLLDLYGELVYHYTQLYATVPDFGVRVDDAKVSTLDDLRAALADATDQWRASQGLPAIEADTVDDVRRMGRFTLSRFLPDFRIGADNHIGEMITSATGELAYLKTIRLSAAQARRGHLLSTIAANGWRLDDAATALHTTADDLVRRLDRAGFADLLRHRPT